MSLASGATFGRRSLAPEYRSAFKTSFGRLRIFNRGAIDYLLELSISIGTKEREAFLLIDRLRSRDFQDAHFLSLEWARVGAE